MLWQKTLFLIVCLVEYNNGRFAPPKVPSFVFPPVPTITRLDQETENEVSDSVQDPEVSPGLFQGDMAMNDETFNFWRVGLKWEIFPDRKWKNGIVPYHISELYEPSDHITIYQAIRTLAFMTCVKFVPWNGRYEDYLLIWPIKYPRGCWSYVGRQGGVQFLSLQPPDERGPNCLGNEGRAIHEIMHAIGIFHEQSRADRDHFVKVHFDNISLAFKSNFVKQSKENTTYRFEYDYDSIMHYGSHYFSESKDKPTLTPKMKGVKQLGQRRGLSKTDCLKINDLYGCLQKPRQAKKYYALCRTLGV